MSEKRLNQALVFSVCFALLLTFMNFTFASGDSRRAPASVPSEKVTLALPEPEKHIKDEILQQNIFCPQAADTSHSTTHRRVILEGSLCTHAPTKSTKVSDVEIINITNGTSVTYFALKQNKFKTDLIFLSPGKNEIRVQYRGPKGFVVKQSIQIVSR